MTLKETLQNATVQEILDTLLEIEQEGRHGLRYDIGMALCTDHANPPYKIFQGRDPNDWTSYKQTFIYVKIIGYDPNRKKEALLCIKKERALTVMESVSALATLTPNTPITYEITDWDDDVEKIKADTDALVSRWRHAGFTVIVEDHTDKNPTSHIKKLEFAAVPRAIIPTAISAA